MLNTFSVATFEPYVGQTFRLRLPDATTVDVTLLEASVLAMDDDARRQRAPFRILFRDPSSRTTRQGIYPVEHHAFEPMSIFLVPIRVDTLGVELEAIFT